MEALSSVFSALLEAAETGDSGTPDLTTGRHKWHALSRSWVVNGALAADHVTFIFLLRQSGEPYIPVCRQTGSQVGWRRGLGKACLTELSS
jgi:hypothetical protein